MFFQVAGCVVLAAAWACTKPAEPDRSGEWLRGDVDARFAQVARHLCGLDMAMVEIGYRYGELYHAGRNGNWDFAAYQRGKIELALANGVARRPKRAASARMLELDCRRSRGTVIVAYALVIV
jgi:hypothetical protein